MQRIPPVLLAALGLGLASCSHGGSCGAPPCLVAQARLVDLNGHMVIPASLNGDPIEAVLDTGAYWSIMTAAAADAAAAETVATTDDYSTGIYNTEGPTLAMGVGGAAAARLRRVEDFTLAGGRARDMTFWAMPALRFHDKRIAGLIGGDILQNWDLDLDFENDEMRLYAPQHEDPVVPPWQGATTRIRWSGEWWIRIPVTLDGHHLLALLDTGAPQSYVADASAAGAEVVPSDPAVTTSGIEGIRMRGHTHHFGDLTIGGHSFGPLDATVAPMRMGDGNVDMLLGADFLSAYRVYIAYHRRELLIDDDTP